jgi:predicted  nucleic acid-binding Zn-ribbon protein
MTFVGKILVIVIMIFAVLFLGEAVVLFTTATNWREKSADLDKANKKLQDEIRAKTQAADDRTKDLADAKAANATQVEQLTTQIQTAEEARKKAEGELTAARTELETRTQTEKAALDEALSLRRETEIARTNQQAAQKQANLFKLQQTELTDRIRVLERELSVAQGNNKSLRDNVNQLSTYLQSKGLTTDPATVTNLVKGTGGAPPDVEGQVGRVDARGQKAELTIGSDDGLVVGHELYVFRTGGTSEYVGKIHIDAVEPDKASGHIIQPYLGRKLQEGDLVAAKIRPRS